MTFPLPQGADLPGQAAAILEAAANGRLPVNHAVELIQGLAGVVALRKAEDFDARLRAVEERISGKPA